MTSTRIQGVVVAVVLLATAVGCEQAIAPPAEGERGAAPAIHPTVTIPRYYAEPAASLSSEDFRAHLEALYDFGPLAQPDAVPSAEDLESYAAFLAAHEGEVYHSALEQTIAFKILDTVLRPDSETTSYVALERETFTPEERAAASFATRLLVKNHSPSADLVAAALEAVEGEWTADEIREAARVTRAATDEWLASRCEDCQAKLVAALPEGTPRPIATAVAARARLVALAR
jgi:hypothetical protein